MNHTHMDTNPLNMTTDPLFLRATLNVINGVSIKNEMIKIPSMSPSLYESLCMFINHIQGLFHKTIGTNTNNHLFIFVCRKNRGWDGFNWIFKVFILETSFFFKFMYRRRERMENITFIKWEKN